MMHESARFASWKNVELYSYLVVTLLLVSSVHHHCQRVLSADNLSLGLLGFSFRKRRKQQCNIKFNVQSSLAKESGCCGWPALLPTWLGFKFWTAMTSDVYCSPLIATFQAPTAPAHLIKPAQNFCMKACRASAFYIMADVEAIVR